MNTLLDTYNREKIFTARIAEKDTDKSGNILQHVLLDQLEQALISPLQIIESKRNLTAKRTSNVYKVDIFGSVQLGDKIYIKINLGDFDSRKMVFHLSYLKKNNTQANDRELICSASFSYRLKNRDVKEFRKKNQ